MVRDGVTVRDTVRLAVGDAVAPNAPRACSSSATTAAAAAATSTRARAIPGSGRGARPDDGCGGRGGSCADGGRSPHLLSMSSAAERRRVGGLLLLRPLGSVLV